MHKNRAQNRNNKPTNEPTTRLQRHRLQALLAACSVSAQPASLTQLTPKRSKVMVVNPFNDDAHRMVSFEKRKAGGGWMDGRDQLQCIHIRHNSIFTALSVIENLVTLVIERIHEIVHSLSQSLSHSLSLPLTHCTFTALPTTHFRCHGAHALTHSLTDPLSRPQTAHTTAQHSTAQQTDSQPAPFIHSPTLPAPTDSHLPSLPHSLTVRSFVRSFVH